MRLALKIPLITACALLVSTGLALGVAWRQNHEQAVAATRLSMGGILNNAERTRESMSRLHHEGAFDIPKLKAELDRVGADRFRETTLYRSVPIVAAWQNASAVAKDFGIDFRVVRENPRNPDNAPSPAERRLLELVGRPGVKEVFEEDHERSVFVLARPIALTRDCLVCHGDPATSPTGDGRDVLGYKMENWREGDVHGAFILSSPSAGADTLSIATTRQTILWLVPAGILLGGIVVLIVRRQVTRPIHACAAAMDQLARGDLTTRVEIANADELGDLGRSINTCVGNLRQLVGSLTQSASDLVRSAQVLTETSHSQAAAAEETTVQANTVASAGEELSINSKTMSESATQITRSTGTVAAAMEEMSSSIQEVARNCAQESEIARKADTQARQTRELMGKLDESARQIGKVVELINRIAEQTNLLALNATIEAASAGEAGRGFAVVANEVKELARQSASATEDIRKQVALIQENAGASSRSLDEVAKVIEQVSHISSSIAAAVEEQSATTSEIVGTIHNVSTATGTLSRNVQQTAEGAAEVARNISGVSQAAADGARGAARISASATELNSLSTSLGGLVARFKI